MSASTNLLADIQSVITNGPSATTLANCIAAAGPILDYKAITALLKTRLQECDNILNGSVDKSLISITDSTDSANLALLQGIQAVLEGTSNPSTQVITDIGTVITNGPNAATKAKAIAAAGPIMGYLDMCNLLLLKFNEVRVWITSSYPVKNLIDVTDTGSDGTNKTLLQNIKLALV